MDIHRPAGYTPARGSPRSRSRDACPRHPTGSGYFFFRCGEPRARVGYRRLHQEERRKNSSTIGATFFIEANADR